jgi:type I restriction enzyme M protein
MRCSTTTATRWKSWASSRARSALIFGKAQNKFQDPAKLRRVIVDLIDAENWSAMGADVKGDAYEGLLERNAQDIKSGAGQYFTPRALIQAMVDCIAPRPGELICDPACGTGGFLFTAHKYLTQHYPNLTRDEKRHLKEGAFRGWELVQATARVCAMNLMLHGIGSEKSVPIKVADALAADPGERFDVVLANPPFGKKSSTMIVGEDGKTSTEKDIVERDDFWATTSNKQLNFVQHIKTLLKPHGRAAVVVPDNVLFEGGAGETIRRKLMHECDVHTLLRLPTGLFYAQGVKANVIFFDKKPASETPWTKKLWIYDLRTNKHFTLKTNPLKREDLDEFVALYNPANRHDRARRRGADREPGPEGRWRVYELRRTDRPRQGEPGHLLAQGRKPRRQRQPAAAGGDRAGDRRGPGGGAGAVQADCGASNWRKRCHFPKSGSCERVVMVKMRRLRLQVDWQLLAFAAWGICWTFRAWKLSLTR